MRTHSGSSNGDKTLMQPTVLKDGHSPLVISATSQHGATPQLFTPEGGRSTQDTAPVLHSADRVGKLGKRVWDLGGRPMHRHWSPPSPLSRARVGARLQLAPPPRLQIRPWSRDPECFGTDRSLGRSAWLVAIQRTRRVRERDGRSSGYLPQSSAAVSLKPCIRPWCVSECQSCHGKERSAGRQMHCVAWTPVSLRSTTANWISVLPRH